MSEIRREASDPQRRVSVTVRVRPRAPIDLARVKDEALQPPAVRHYPSRQEYAAEHGADPADLAAVEAFARDHGLVVEESSAARRSVALSGTAQALASAFGLESPDEPKGPIPIPAALSGIAEAITGFSERPYARPHGAEPPSQSN